MSPAVDETKAGAGFRRYLPDLESPRFRTGREQDAYSYADAFKSKQHPPWLYDLTQAWERLLEEPYKGVTTDGSDIPLPALTIYTCLYIRADPH